MHDIKRSLLFAAFFTLFCGVYVLFTSHALLESLSQANLLMQIILLLISWQFAFGLFLLSRYQVVFVNKMKKYSYMAHSQLYTGIAIGLCAIFGHLLVNT